MEPKVWRQGDKVFVKFKSKPGDHLLGMLKKAGFRWEFPARRWSCAYSEEVWNVALRVQGHVEVATPQLAGNAGPSPSQSPHTHLTTPSVDVAEVSTDDPTDDFDYAGATEDQRQAIRTTEGPLLITAGPGTGKTKTLVTRVMYLIQKCGVEPGQIMVATFTVKAANELLARLADEARRRHIDVDVQDMYLGTFHSICLRLLKEHAEDADLPKSFGTADEFTQKYLVYRRDNIKAFMETEGAEDFRSWHSGQFPDKSKFAKEIAEASDRLLEEGVDIDALARDADRQYRTYGLLAKKYFDLLKSNRKLDFAQQQVLAYEMISKNEAVLRSVREKISYVMVDEYQDTNHVQEQLAFLISDAEHGGNLCVVGDDDQSLYRFRGATVRNILEFKDRFDGRCAEVRLEINFRSNPEIVDFCRTWIENPQNACRDDFPWEEIRLPKHVVAYEGPGRYWPQGGRAVARISGQSEASFQKIYDFIQKLRETGKIDDYNQVAFLFSSLTWSWAPKLAGFFEGQEPPIHVYAPKSGAYFEREEIRLALGVLLHVFPSVVSNGLTQKDRDKSGLTRYWAKDVFKCLQDCYRVADKELRNLFDLEEWVLSRREEVGTDKANYGLPELAYQMFAFEPFRTYLDADVSAGVCDTRFATNLAILIDMLVDFQEANGIRELKSNIDCMLKQFAEYLKLKVSGRMVEREDDRDALPSGCVTFMTIHQAKGMEFPVAFVDLSRSSPRKGKGDQKLLDIIETRGSGLGRERREHYDTYDFLRKYYVAFSRAKDLLVLIGEDPNKRNDNWFAWLEADELNPNHYLDPTWHFSPVGASDVKETYSFTSDVAVYDTCARQYKFQKVLKFPGVLTPSMLYGTLVHQTIEDVHRAVMRGEWVHGDARAMDDRIKTWFSANCAMLSKTQNEDMSSGWREGALKDVLRYAHRRNGRWPVILEPEVKVTYITDDYIITGNVDLIQGEGDTVELVDFKTEDRGQLEENAERLARYERQLRLYAFLVESKDPGRKVSKLHLYCTRTKEYEDPLITYCCSSDQLEQEAQAFEDTVKKIQAMKFDERCEKGQTCDNCDFRWYCWAEAYDPKGRRPTRGK